MMEIIAAPGTGYLTRPWADASEQVLQRNLRYTVLQVRDDGYEGGVDEESGESYPGMKYPRLVVLVEPAGDLPALPKRKDKSETAFEKRLREETGLDAETWARLKEGAAKTEKPKERAAAKTEKPKPPPQVKEPILKGDFFSDLTSVVADDGTTADLSWSEEAKAEVRAYLEKHDWKMYHGTTPKYAENIAKNGLLSLKDQGIPAMSNEELENFDEPYIWDGVYMGDRNRAEDFGDVILEIDLKDSPWERSLFEFAMDGEGTEYESVDMILAGSIPPDRIKVVKQ